MKPLFHNYIITFIACYIYTCTVYGQKSNNVQNINIVVNGQQETQLSTSGFVILYGYLKVITNELGYFDSEPVTIIQQINDNVRYGYNTWRLPTDEELILLQSNKLAQEGVEYMTSLHRQGHVILVTETETAKVIKHRQDSIREAKRSAEIERRRAEERRLQEEMWQRKRQETAAIADSLKKLDCFVDLGLPSGTMWKVKSEKIISSQNAFTYNEAYLLFGKNIPTKKQCQELIEHCRFIEMLEKGKLSGYVVIGPNGNSIYLNELGKYWAVSDSDRETLANTFNSKNVEVTDKSDYWGVSLVNSGHTYYRITQKYIELGLPSGKKWAIIDNANTTYRPDINNKNFSSNSFETELRTFRLLYGFEPDDIPTKEDWLELRDFCTWEWQETGFMVIGPNGNFIILTVENRDRKNSQIQSLFRYNDNAYLGYNALVYAYRIGMYIYEMEIDKNKRMKFHKKTKHPTYSLRFIDY